MLAADALELGDGSCEDMGMSYNSSGTCIFHENMFLDCSTRLSPRLFNRSTLAYVGKWSDADCLLRSCAAVVRKHERWLLLHLEAAQ